MRNSHYIIVDKVPVAVDARTWCEWFENAGEERFVAKTTVGEAEVSTVFLGLDHQFSLSEDAPPVLFETMIFGGEHDGDIWRWHTWVEAEQMHQKVVDMVFGVLAKDDLDKLVSEGSSGQ